MTGDGSLLKTVVHCLFFLLLLSVSADTSLAQAPRWRTLANAPARSSRHDDVFFWDQSLGWVVNGGGQVFKTTDGGATWQLKFTAPAYLRSVGFATPSRGWAGTLDSAKILYQTTDAGTTWSLGQNIPSPHPEGICGISVVSSTVMYGSGRYDGPAKVIKTLNRGVSWTLIDMSPYAGALVDCYFFHQDSGFVVGSTNSDYTSGYPVILFTYDGGTTWVPRHTGTRQGELCWKLFFPTRTIGYVSIEHFQGGPTYYLKTTDGGATWTDRLFLSTSYDVQGIGFWSDSVGWMGGWGGSTYETTNAGASWHVATFGYNVNRFRMLSDTLGYAVGQTVYKYSRDSATVDVQAREPGVPLSYRFEQNYPNPFNPSTEIRYEIAQAGLVTLTVFDLLGKNVATLVNELKAPGRYNTTWDAGGLPSGVYYCRLMARDFVETKKMLLIK